MARASKSVAPLSFCHSFGFLALFLNDEMNFGKLYYVNQDLNELLVKIEILVNLIDIYSPELSLRLGKLVSKQCLLCFKIKTYFYYQYMFICYNDDSSSDFALEL